MKKIYSLLIFTLALNYMQSFAQNHFIYIQSESKQPFTVILSDKKFNSTSAGYVIIPRLKNGQYDLTVKFKDAQVPESRFTSIIDKKDLGYTLKDVGNSLALTNIQSYETLTAAPIDSYAKNDKNSAITKETDAEKAPPTSKANAANKPSKEPAKKPADKKLANAATTVKLKKGINKISEVQSSNNVSLLFIDVQGNRSDTIDVVIPATNKEEPVQSRFNNSANENSLFQWASADQSEYIDPEFQNGYNTKCVHLLTKDDYTRLRKRMAAESNETKMIGEAVKAANNKCFTTSQVKMLSALFPKDQAKLKFFAALYSYVYDYVHYPSLESEFSDVSYATGLQMIVKK